MIRKIANAVGYQIVWLVSVTGASHGSPYSGPMVAIAFALMVLAFGRNTREDIRLIPIALMLGLIADSAWIGLGWLDYSASWDSVPLAPGWILGIWLAFGLTLNHSLGFLKHHHVLGALLGAVGGPLAYWAASRAGAVHFAAPVSTVLIGLSIAWAVLVPLLMRIAEYGSTPDPSLAPSREAHP